VAKKRGLHFPFPVGGLDEAQAYTGQPPYTSPDLQNVRAFDVVEERWRGGQRPGLSKAWEQELGGGSPVRYMGQVTVVESSESGRRRHLVFVGGLIRPRFRPVRFR